MPIIIILLRKVLFFKYIYIKPLSCGIGIYPVLENIVDPDQLAFQEQTNQDLYDCLSCI